MKTKIWFVLFYKKNASVKIIQIMPTQTQKQFYVSFKVKFKSTSYYFKGNLNEKIFKLN